MKEQELFESGEDVNDLFESGEDVDTLFESGEEVESPVSVVSTEQPKKVEEYDVLGAVADSVKGAAKGAAIGTAIGKGSQMGIDKVLDLSPETISKVPGGRLAEEDIKFIQDNSVDYKAMDSASRNKITDDVARAAEKIKDRSFELPKEAKDVMDKDKIKVMSSEIKSDIANTLLNDQKRYGSEIKPSKLKTVIERDEYGDIVEKSIKDAAKSSKSNVPKELVAYNPKLANLYISDKGLLSKINSLVEELNNIEGDTGARAYERVQNIRDTVNMGEPGGSDQQQFFKDVAHKIRSRVGEASPEADTKLLQASGKLQDYETLRSEAKLAEKTASPDVIPDFKDSDLPRSGVDEESLFKAMNDPNYSKTVVAKDATDRMLSNMGKQGLEFRRTLDNITSVLEKNGYPDIAKQFRMQAIKEVAKTKKIPTSAWVERVLLGGAFAAVGAPAVGTGVAALSTAADLFGTKAQESLATKSFKKITNKLPLVGGVLGGALGTITGRAADIIDEPTPANIGLESAVTLGMGIPAATLAPSMALKTEAIGPKKALAPEMSSLEGSLFEEEATNPEYALESGTPLSEYQKMKLQKMQEETKSNLSNSKPDFKEQEEVQEDVDKLQEIPSVIKPEVSKTPNESLFKNIVQAKERKLKDFKLKNTLTNLEDDDIDSISSVLSSNPSPSAQEFVAQLANIKTTQGRERTSKLFSLMQQPGFRSLIKKKGKSDVA